MSNNRGSKKQSGNKTGKDAIQDKVDDVAEGAGRVTQSSAELLSATIKSGVELIASVIDETKKVKEEVGCVVCEAMPKTASETAEIVSKTVSETLNLADSNLSAAEEVISREEFDLLKLDVIRLKTQVDALLKQKE